LPPARPPPRGAGGPGAATTPVGPDPPQGQGTAPGRRTGVVACARAGSRPAADGEAAGAGKRHRRLMSTRWRCAICEAVNDGGETCAACGATVTQTVVQPAPAEAP